jgi:hypothetical protein
LRKRKPLLKKENLDIPEEDFLEEGQFSEANIDEP